MRLQVWDILTDNNNNRQGCLPFEESYCGKRWDLRKFGFIVALCQVNAMLAMNYFTKKDNTSACLSKAEFLRLLAGDLINDHCPGGDMSFGGAGSMMCAETRMKPLPIGCVPASKCSHVARAGHDLIHLDPFKGKWNGLSSLRFRQLIRDVVVQ